MSDGEDMQWNETPQFYGLIVAVVERRLNQEMPPDITDPVDRLTWAMFPIRDILAELHAQIREMREEIDGRTA